MALSEPFTFNAELWLWKAQASWVFVALPEDITDEIDERYGRLAAGFGSIKVEVRVGSTVWRTSVFPDAGRGTLVLPVKKDVRKREGLEVGATGQFEVRVVTD